MEGPASGPFFLSQQQAMCPPTNQFAAVTRAACLVASLLLSAATSAQAPISVSVRPLKVVIITMFAPEAKPWIAPLKLDQEIPVSGLLPESNVIRCNTDDVCLMIAGMGHANVASSVTALTLDPRFDLRQTYFLIAGIAGIDPAQGTTGTATWARYLVDVGIAHEIDAREMPRGWTNGYLGIMTRGPGEKPKFEYHTEVAQLDEALLQRALALSRNAALADSDKAKRYRANYRKAPANQAPTVRQCDTLSGDTWWHGHRLGRHASDWTRLLTDGRGSYCTTQQEDNATYNALSRVAAAGKVDLKRLAVLRTASNFDRPYPGQSAYASLMASTNGGSGGFGPATENLYRVGSLLVNDIVSQWAMWQNGAPRP